MGAIIVLWLQLPPILRFVGLEAFDWFGSGFAIPILLGFALYCAWRLER